MFVNNGYDEIIEFSIMANNGEVVMVDSGDPRSLGWLGGVCLDRQRPATLTN